MSTTNQITAQQLTELLSLLEQAVSLGGKTVSATYYDAMKNYCDDIHNPETGKVSVDNGDNKQELFRQLSPLLFRTNESADATLTESLRLKRADCALAFMSAYQAFVRSQGQAQKKCVDGDLARRVVTAWLEGERSTQVRGTLGKMLQGW